MNLFTRKIVAALLLMSVAAFAQAPDITWSKQFKSTGKDYGNGITVAPSGDIYVAGEFNSTLDLGNNVTVTSRGNFDFFLARLDATGKTLWAKSGGGNLTDRAYSVVIDHSGDIIAGGSIYNVATFDDFTLTAIGNLDFIIAKYDSLGNIKWIKQGKGAAQDIARCVGIDSSGNIITAGYYGSYSADTINYEGLSLRSNGSRDAFILKTDNDGVPVWAVTMGSVSPLSGKGDEIRDIDIDRAGNVYVTGICNDSAAFGSTNLYNNNSVDIFIAKYTSNGELAWFKTAGGIKGDAGYGIKLDGKGNLYTCGYIDSAGAFLGENVITAGGYDTYLAKLDTSGNLIWLEMAGGTANDYAVDIEYSGEVVYLAGYYENTYTTQGSSITSAGNEDLFFACYGENGSLIWIKSAGGIGADKNNVIALDDLKDIYTTGYFSNTISIGDSTYTSAGAEDVFVVKMGNMVVPVELTSFSAAVVKEGVKLNWSTATETNNSGFRVERKSANSSWEDIAFVEGKGTTSSKNSYSYTDNTASAGKYYYRLKQVDYDGSFEYSNTIEVNTAIPAKFEVFQNYPNPFNPATNIKFNLPLDANVKITLVNMLGEESLIMQDNCTAGTNQITFNASGFASGTYVYVVKATGADGSVMTSSKKLVLVK
jgi:hypothetical protein